VYEVGAVAITATLLPLTSISASDYVPRTSRQTSRSAQGQLRPSSPRRQTSAFQANKAGCKSLSARSTQTLKPKTTNVGIPSQQSMHGSTVTHHQTDKPVNAHRVCSSHHCNPSSRHLDFNKVKLIQQVRPAQKQAQTCKQNTQHNDQIEHRTG
jgi:hypothetical protein